MKKIMSNKWYIMIFLLPALVLYLGFTILPIITTFIYSFFDYNGIGSMTFNGLQNYLDIFTKDPYTLLAIKNSLILVVASLLIQLTLALILALIISRGVKGEKFFRTVYFIPVVISSMVIGQLWLKIFNSDYGLLNTLIRAFGNPDYNYSWLATKKTAFLTTVIPAVWQYIGYYMLIFYAGIKSISPEYYEAAKLDGASERQIHSKITIPLLAPIIKICVVFSITGALRSFDLIFVMTGGGPNHASEVPATLMYTNLFSKGIYGYGSAQAVFIVVECLVLTFIVNKMFKKAEENASVL